MCPRSNTVHQESDHPFNDFSPSVSAAAGLENSHLKHIQARLKIFATRSVNLKNELFCRTPVVN
jgi:hypothetical protein